MHDSKLIIALLNTISRNITTTIIRNRQPILITVSGGQDSICLLFIFIQLKKQWKWAFGILYCNHLWQKNSFYTGSVIVKISYLFNISIYYVTSSNKAFNEESSRDWRYKTFYRISFFYNYNIVLTGHTLSDKMETILFQFIRGTSPENLVSLNFLKHFSSNKKFIKNSQIKHIYFYPIKNFNSLITSVPVRCLYLVPVPFVGKITFSVRHFAGSWPCFARLTTILKPSYAQPTHWTHKSVFAEQLKDLTCTSVMPMPKNFLSYQQIVSLKLYPVFHQNNQLVIKAININKDLKICKIFINLKKVEGKAQKKTQHVWIFCKRPTKRYGAKHQVSLATVPFSPILMNKYPPNGQIISLQAKNNLNTCSVKSTIEPTKLIVVRPMLLLSRFDLKKLLLFFILPIYPDLTNQKKIYYRNRIRKELLPSLKFFFNPQIEVNFVHFSEILNVEQFYFNLVFQRLKKELYIFTENKFILNISFFYIIPIAFRRRLIKQVLVDCTNKNIGFINIEKILNLLYKPQVYINCLQTTFYSRKDLKLKYFIRSRKAVSDWKLQNVQLASTSKTGFFATNSYIEHILNTKAKNAYNYGNQRFILNSDTQNVQVQSTKPCKSNVSELYYKYNSDIRLQINQVQNTNKKLYISYNIYHRLVSNRFVLKYRLFYNVFDVKHKKPAFSGCKFSATHCFAATGPWPLESNFNKIDNKNVCKIFVDKSNATTAPVPSFTRRLTSQKTKKNYKIITIYKFHNRKNQFNFKKLV